MDGSPPSPGMPAALAALIIALDESGAMPKQRYLDALTRVWTALPDDESFDRESVVCQQLLDYLS